MAATALLSKINSEMSSTLHRGGDSSEVKDQLQNLLQIEGSERAFAAILSDGSLVAWGDPMCGGEFKIRTHVVHMETALSRMCG